MFVTIAPGNEYSTATRGGAKYEFLGNEKVKKRETLNSHERKKTQACLGDQTKANMATEQIK